MECSKQTNRQYLSFIPISVSKMKRKCRFFIFSFSPIYYGSWQKSYRTSYWRQEEEMLMATSLCDSPSHATSTSSIKKERRGKWLKTTFHLIFLFFWILDKKYCHGFVGENVCNIKTCVQIFRLQFWARMFFLLVSIITPSSVIYERIFRQKHLMIKAKMH